MVEKLVLRLRELYAIGCMLLSWLVAKLCRPQQAIWLFSERGTDARDNGFWLFRYVKENHPEINAKFIISYDSEDRAKLSEWEACIVKTDSLRHYILMWRASYCLSTHNCGCFPYYIKKIPILSRLVRRGNKGMRIVWLQHGVTKHDMPAFHYERLIVDKVICGAYPEYEFVLKTFHIPKEVACYTGLARFDGLHDAKVNPRQILLMPTWRIWLHQDNFFESDFWKTYSSLLMSPHLHRLLQESGHTLVFYPHYEMQPYLRAFEKLNLPSCIRLADKAKYDVQTLLKESALLITDYSSVFFDFAYMYKPIIFFQFDYDEFHQKHYQRGYFDFKHCFADWTDDITSLLLQVKASMDRHYQLSEEQRTMIDVYFPLHDSHNCDRIYQEVIKG